MKRTITFAAVALCAAFAFAGYEEWYTPAEAFNKQKVDLSFWVGDKSIQMSELQLDTNLFDVEAAVEQAVRNSSLSENAKNAFALGKRALSEAMFAQLQSEMNRQKIDSLGASVETIFQLTNADKVDSSGAVISSGKLADGVRSKMLQKKNALIGGGGTGGAGGEGGEDKPLQIQVTDFPYDTHEFEQIQMDENKSKMGLKGYKDLRPIQSFPFSSGLYGKVGWIPFSEGQEAGGDPNDLTWCAWGGLDTDVIDVLAGTEGDDGKISLKDWRGGTGGCELNVKGLLTDIESSDYQEARNTHMFLTRCKDGDEYKLHYMSVGDVIESITPVPPDEATIQTYITEDGSSTNIVLYGSYEANEEAAESETEIGLIPYVDGGDTLAWAGLSEFFSENIFETNSKGQIKLRGVGEEQGKVKVLAVTGGSGEGEDPVLSSFSGDGISIDFGIDNEGAPQSPLAQLHNFDDPTREGASTENDFAEILTNVDVVTTGWYVPLRNGDGVLQYSELKKLTGKSSPVDGKTIETSPDEGDDEGQEKLRIAGSKTAQAGQLLRMGKEGAVEWADAPFEIDCEDEVKDTYPLYMKLPEEGSDEPTKLGLRGWDTVDSPNGIYGAYEGEGKLYRFADIGSIDVDDEGATPSLEVSGWKDANENSIPYRGDGSSMGMGWIAPPSDATRIAPKTLQYDGTSLVWGDGVPSQGVTKFEGTDGSIAVCTNKVTFATAHDSNVKITVSDEGMGNVKITFGVYYK